jgi:hypothetical protein
MEKYEKRFEDRLPVAARLRGDLVAAAPLARWSRRLRWRLRQALQRCCAGFLYFG